MSKEENNKDGSDESLVEKIDTDLLVIRFEKSEGMAQLNGVERAMIIASIRNGDEEMASAISKALDQEDISYAYLETVEPDVSQEVADKAMRAIEPHIQLKRIHDAEAEDRGAEATQVDKLLN